ncbi:nucleotide disphospho-sugar-binding domain-containing protein [Actinomadura miaoliensis]|uniref:Salmochelin biosynthesis C-glycosyltransferase IroB n=1 Tax=Actinomadura miaoliensis TaxID=430685 RepID=A0ABP7WA95_9ACTN
MRVLFVAAPAIGHAYPMVPLAWAFRAAGHDVVFLTGGDGRGVARAGLPVLDALPGVTSAELLAGFARDFPELFAPIEGESVEAMVAAMDRRKPFIVAAWDAYVDDYVALARRARPDLVVYEPFCGAGPLAAALLDVPAVAHGLSATRFAPEILRADPAVEAFRRHGVEPPDGIPTIDVAPPGIAEGPPSDLAMRYVPYTGGGTLGDLLLVPPERPRVLVTAGSLLPDTEWSRPVERVIAAAPDVDAEFVVTLGHEHPEGPPDLPPNVRTTGWVPFAALLRTCRAAIHLGSGGTMLTCCALGVPQLALPPTPDRQIEAALHRARGTARVLRPEELDAGAIDALLSDEELRTTVRQVQAEMTALPSPAEMALRLTGVAYAATR